MKKKIIIKEIIKKKRQILSVGRLVKQKDFLNLIKAFYLFNKKNNSYSMVIVGSGKLKSILKKVINGYLMKKKLRLLIGQMIYQNITRSQNFLFLILYMKVWAM